MLRKLEPGRFGFVIHPITHDDYARKYPLLGRLPAGLRSFLFRQVPPIKVSHITGIRTPHNTGEGWFTGVPLSSEQIMTLPESFVYRRIAGAVKLAASQGARIVGLGAFTSVRGDGGITIARMTGVPITTGNSYTAYTAVEGAFEAARVMGHEPHQAEFAVIGATGSTGGVCAQLLARHVRHLTLVGRNAERLEAVAEKIRQDTGLLVQTSLDLRASLRRADVIISVSSAVDAIIQPDDLKPGAVVCDVARPRDVAAAVAHQRDDVLVIDGGVVRVPGDPNFHFDFGFPPCTAMACMAETMILSLENRYDHFSLGKELSLAQVDEIATLAQKHGFRTVGFRSFERALGPSDLARIRERADERRRALTGAFRAPAGAAAGATGGDL